MQQVVDKLYKKNMAERNGQWQFWGFCGVIHFGCFACILQHCTKNQIYTHLLMCKYGAKGVQMCSKHGKCRIYYTFTRGGCKLILLKICKHQFKKNAFSKFLKALFAHKWLDLGHISSSHQPRDPISAKIFVFCRLSFRYCL